MDPIDTLQELIERAGSIKAAARDLGTPESNLRYWLSISSVPRWRVQALEHSVWRLRQQDERRTGAR